MDHRTHDDTAEWLPPRGSVTRVRNAGGADATVTPPETDIVFEGGGDENKYDENFPAPGNFNNSPSSPPPGSRGSYLAPDPPSPLPRVTAWYGACCQIHAFEITRETILTHWRRMDESGQFDAIREEVARGAGGDPEGGSASGGENGNHLKWKYP